MKQQFRTSASPEVIGWIGDFTDNGHIGKMPIDLGERYENAEAKAGDGKTRRKRAPYEIVIFDFLVEFFEVILKRLRLSLIVGTARDFRVCWRRKTGNTHSNHLTARIRIASVMWGCIEMITVFGSMEQSQMSRHSVLLKVFKKLVCVMKIVYRIRWERRTNDDYFSRLWTCQLIDSADSKQTGSDLAWAEKSWTINEVGSTFTILGFDFNPRRCHHWPFGGL